jgi:septum formation protein
MMEPRVITTLVLASESPRRRELLASLGVELDVVPSRYQEMNLPELPPIELARTHARGKLRGAPKRQADDIVVAADTVVDLDGLALGKPRDSAEAVSMLTALSGRKHVVHTAFAVTVGSDVIERTASTEVRFWPLSQAEIAAYVATGDSMDKAGSYGIQGQGAALVERIDGDFYTVMGFPLGLFVRTLRDHGVILGGTR